MQMDGQVCRGVIQDLSFMGSLFAPERPLFVKPGARGRMRFSVPTSSAWIEPNIELRRITTIPRATGESAQAIGFQFNGLSAVHERAIATACLDWTRHRLQDYALNVDCLVQGMDEHRHYSRYGRINGGSRTRARVSVASAGELKALAKVRLKVNQTPVEGRIDDVRTERNGFELTVSLTGWGRDFFLHEARHASAGGAAGSLGRFGL